MDQKYIEYLVHRILSGKIIFYYDNVRYELHKPSLELKLQSDLLYKQSYNLNLFDNFWLLEDIPNLAIEIGLIEPEYKKHIDRIEKALDSNKVSLYKEYFNLSQRKKNQTKITDTKRQLSLALHNLHYLDYLSLEHYCEKIKNEFIITNCLYYAEKRILVFNRANIEYNFFNNLMSEISSHILSIDIYKEIARNEYWRNLWSNNRYKIINEPVNEWSDEQKTLFNISSMYDRIYEHPEAPVEAIITDNDALDGWMIYQKQENLKNKREKGVDSMLSDKVKGSSEIFLMASDEEQAQTIKEFNSPQSLNKIKDKINFIQAHTGPVKDAELPDVKQEIITKLKRGR